MWPKIQKFNFVNKINIPMQFELPKMKTQAFGLYDFSQNFFNVTIYMSSSSTCKIFDFYIPQKLVKNLE